MCVCVYIYIYIYICINPKIENDEATKVCISGSSKTRPSVPAKNVGPNYIR